ncbi:MAG: DNA topoisomerase IV subunit A [Kiritimatiellae bacterium]|nr:DNA topoisomerase IV subunit A [Kiritimatiellia bacterium]
MVNKSDKQRPEQQELTFSGKKPAFQDITKKLVKENDPSENILSKSHDPLKDLVDDNFMQYASYVICERAIPHLADGFKPVQRRIMHALYEKDDGRFIKVANIVGHTMQYHPHGDASIGAALVNLTNKNFLIEGQGNFGNIYTGDSAAASRYIECRLTPLARNELFNKKLTRFVASYDGRNKEPVTLPSKLPLLLMLGAEGIAVGLSTRILPHNFKELLEAEIAILKKKPFQILPDFPQGGLMDVSGYDKGNGSVKVRARIEPAKKDHLVIREIPYGTTTESLITSIEDAARLKKIPVRSIDDFTSEHVEIELRLQPNTDPKRAMDALYAFTSCETTLNSNLVVIHNKRPVKLTVNDVVKENARQFVKVLQGELTNRENELLEEFHARTLTRIFIEERIYKQIEKCKTQETVLKAVLDGIASFQKELRRDVTKNDVDMLLSLRIRRISLFDINKNKKEIETILAELDRVKKNLATLTKYAIRTLQGLIKKYGDQYPRHTEITNFKEVKIKELTANELNIFYDKKTGYLGHSIKGDSALECSSYDKVLLIWRDGRYKVLPPPDKLFVDKNLLYCAKVDRKQIFTLVYTADALSYIKRFTIGGTILNKEYLCTLPDSRIQLLEKGTSSEIYVKYKPAKGQRIHQQMFKPEQTPVKGAKVRGNHMTSKTIDKITTKMPKWWENNAKGKNGILLD